jgi:chorismate dehydratase
MVSYLNSKPFDYGIMHGPRSSAFHLMTATPSMCARLFDENQVDIALVPSGALHDLSGNYDIVSNYGIGCDGEVRTVCIFSNEPLRQCQTLIADNDSRTSILLSALLLQSQFDIFPILVPQDVHHVSLKPGEAVLLIGDKVFEMEDSFSHKYDLGAAWKTFSGLPFAFAVWVARQSVSRPVIEDMNICFEHGMSNLNQIINQESSENLDLYYYLKNNISYHLDDDKKKALALFLDLTKNIHDRIYAKK